MINTQQFQNAILILTELHKQDPTLVDQNGIQVPAELLYVKRMEEILNSNYHNAPLAVKLAAHAQHLKRWMVARSNFSMDKNGYYQWRKAVMDFQIAQLKEVLENVGVGRTDIMEVVDILTSQGNKTHIQAQIIQDVACIVFVVWYLEEFAAKHDQSKVVDIVAKTTKKMSSQAIQIIKGKTHSPAVQKILSKL